VELTQAAESDILRKLKWGEEISPLAWVEASRNRIQAETAFLGVQYRFLSNEDRLARLIFHGDYGMRPAYTESLRKWNR
jgi:hypothetical protein